MVDDVELLRRYHEEHAEDAFTELVRRHLPLVYRAALRQNGGRRANAEEAAQAVFLLLSRKAGKVARHPALVGWLHKAACLTVADAARAERRRRRREEKAARVTEDSEPLPTQPCDWTQIQPLVDEALQRLEPADRDAVLLRFFDDQPFAEIGRRLKIKEDTARMRVNRALQRLGEFLRGRGIASTEAALAAMLAGEASAASVPAGLAESVVLKVQRASLGGAAGSVALFMSAKKTVIVIAALAALFLASIGVDRLIVRPRQAVHRLERENASLRDRLAAAARPGPKGGAGTSLLATLSQRVEQRHDVRPDDMPTTIAHPLKFRGWDTPIHAVETFTWASYHADLGVLSETLYFDDAARRVTEEVRTGLAPAVQAQYPTPESLVALWIAYDAIDHPGPNNEDVFIDAPPPKQVSDTEIVLRNNWVLHKTADGWKWSVPARYIQGALTHFLSGK